MANRVRQAGDSVRNTEFDSACGQGQTVFRVRTGPDYSKHRKKAPSGPPFFKPVAVDVFKLPTKAYHVMQYIRLPKIPADMREKVNGVPPFLVINCLLPGYDPPNPIWGSTKEDGVGYSVVIYLLMTDLMRNHLKNLDTAPVAVELYRKLLFNEDDHIRFKGMGNFLNPDQVDMGYPLRKLLTDYNMRPVLTRPQHQFFSDDRSYFEVDVDVHEFNYIARKGLCMLRPLLPKMVWDVGATVEGWTDAELPENMLFVVHIPHLQLEKGESIDFSQLPKIKADEWDDNDLSVCLDNLNLDDPSQEYGAADTPRGPSPLSERASLIDLLTQDDVNVPPKGSDDEDDDDDFEDAVQDQS